MPSHISHALLAESCIESLEKNPRGIPRELLPDTPHLRSLAVLGAQGPDIFLHNHRRKPRAFRYGAILHRKGNARVLASLALTAGTSRESTAKEILSLPARELAAFSLGYISHVWLDRFVHPFVNYRSGWRGVPDKHPDRPAMHAFLERIIDIQLLRLLRNQSVQEYRFLDRISPQRHQLVFLRKSVARAIQDSLRSAGDDRELERRIANALYDSLSYYRFTESPGAEYFSVGRARERAGLITPRWLSVVHPPEELLILDGLNRDQAPWKHPCDPSRTSNATVPSLFNRAQARTLEVFGLWVSLVLKTAPPEKMIQTLGEENLNDGISGDPPCRKIHCDPLPLLSLYHQIKSAFDK
ncbi:hypothetical protein SAMN05920897_10510 [Alkalispirochaeta americana]|uniref:Zinc dependent phospholipase C n=1 Tax=Alkalispirochaeta americana TaxID=159291 RepID=A0A1N6QQA6_9SPIO|nr:zinc dependent phospholipase C family protein [Alkalispirochaeta americana]SIQ18783.1 hypothetical protein SAMN05920897_10510 [Alkalispirochaeta americana]